MVPYVKHSGYEAHDVRETGVSIDWHWCGHSINISMTKVYSIATGGSGALNHSKLECNTSKSKCAQYNY